VGSLPWTLNLLGCTELRGVNGATVLLKTRRSLLLLAVLAESSDEGLARTALAEILWPDADLKSARDRLRNELANLNRCGAGDLIETDPQYVRLRPGRLRRDWQEVKSHRDYRGDFMPGFDHDWAIDQRLRLRSAACASAMSEARRQHRAGAKGKAAALARRACQIDPLNEKAAALNIRLLEDSGKPQAAVAACDGYRSRAFRQLGFVSKIRTGKCVATGHPLVEACRWMIEHSPNESISLLASSPQQWLAMPIDTSLDLHRRALQTSVEQGAQRRLVEGQFAYLSVLAGQLTKVETLAKKSYDLAVANGEPLAAARLSIALAYANLSRGRFKRSHDEARRALAAALQAGDPQVEAEFEIHWSIILNHVGFHRQSWESLRRSKAKVEQCGTPQLMASIQIIEFDHLIENSKVDLAMSQLASAQRIYETCGIGRNVAWVRMCEGILHEATGDVHRALDSFQSILRLPKGDIGHSAIAMATDRIANLQCRVGEYQDAADSLARALVFRKSLGSVPSLSESILIRKTRRTLSEKLEEKEIHAAFRRASQAGKAPCDSPLTSVS